MRTRIVILALFAGVVLLAAKHAFTPPEPWDAASKGPPYTLDLKTDEWGLPEFELTNHTGHNVNYSGWERDRPVYVIERRNKNGDWEPSRRFKCGTGVERHVLAPGRSITFDVQPHWLDTPGRVSMGLSTPTSFLQRLCQDRKRYQVASVLVEVKPDW